MSIIIFERHGDRGVFLSDTFITRPTGPSHLISTIVNHSLKVHPINGHLCIGVCGDGYNLGLESIKKFSERFQSDGFSPEGCARDFLLLHEQLSRNAGHDPNSVDFIVSWNSGDGLNACAIRNGALLEVREGCFIGDQGFYDEYKTDRERVALMPDQTMDGRLISDDVREVSRSVDTFKKIIGRRGYSSIGTISNFGADLRYEANEGFTFPVAAEMSTGPSEDPYRHSTYISMKGPRVLAYYFRNLRKGFLFLPGAGGSKEFAASRGEDFKAQVYADLGIEILGSEWE